MYRDESYQIRIAGVGNYTTGVQYIYHTRLPDSPLTQEEGGVSSIGRIASSSVEVMAPLGSSGGMSVSVILDEASEKRRALVDRRILWHGVSPTPPRMTEPMGAQGTVLRISVDLSAGLYVWINGEVIRLTTRLSAGVYLVSRGQMGTQARVHDWELDIAAGPEVLSRQPFIDGARCTVLRSDRIANTEAVIYRGAIQTVSIGPAHVTMSIGSALSHLRGISVHSGDIHVYQPDAPYAPVTVDVPNRSGPYLAFFASSIAETASGLVRIWYGQIWTVQAWTLSLAQPFDRRACDVIRTIIQWGMGSAVYPADTPPRGLDAENLRITSVEILPRAQGTVSECVSQLLRFQFPTGACGGLATADIGDLSALDRAYVGPLLAPHASPNPGNFFWPSPDSNPKSIAEWVSRGVAVLGCAIVADKRGRISAIDWSRGLDANVNVTTADLRAVLDRTDPAAPVRMVSVTSTGAAGERVDRWQTTQGTQISGQGAAIDLAPGWFSGLSPVMSTRIGALVQVWQNAAPRAVISTSRGVDVEPGATIALTCSTVIGVDGSRGIVEMAAMVLGRSESPDTMVVDYELALTGFGVTRRTGQWAPTVEVVSDDGGGVYTVDESEFSDLPLTGMFYVGDKINICGPDGETLGTGLIDAVTATTLEWTGDAATAGDIIVLDPYLAPVREWAYFADAAGVLGASDPPYRYV